MFNVYDANIKKISRVKKHSVSSYDYSFQSSGLLANEIA
jgi:hypothetical protein